MAAYRTRSSSSLQSSHSAWRRSWEWRVEAVSPFRHPPTRQRERHVYNPKGCIRTRVPDTRRHATTHSHTHALTHSHTRCELCLRCLAKFDRGNARPQRMQSMPGTPLPPLPLQHGNSSATHCDDVRRRVRDGVLNATTGAVRKSRASRARPNAAGPRCAPTPKQQVTTITTICSMRAGRTILIGTMHMRAVRVPHRRAPQVPRVDSAHLPPRLPPLLPVLAVPSPSSS